MKTIMVKIGNSQEIIIPKKLLNTFGESKSVNIQEKDGGVLITPLSENKARADWETRLNDAITKGYTPEDDSIQVENDFDKEQWTW